MLSGGDLEREGEQGTPDHHSRKEEIWIGKIFCFPKLLCATHSVLWWIHKTDLGEADITQALINTEEFGEGTN